MCFAPQRCALFQNLNFQKKSELGVFRTILTWKCSSRHNGVHFFDISIFKRGPKLRCYVHFELEMCFAPQWRVFSFLIWPAGSAPAALASVLFQPPKPQIINTVFRNFPTFSRICIFFLLIFSFLTLLTSAFQHSISSEISRLNFFRLLIFHFSSNIFYSTSKISLKLSYFYFKLY